MSLALLASLALSAKPPVYDKPLPPPPPLPVEVSQAYPGCFALGNGGEYINLNAICNSQPVAVPPPSVRSTSVVPTGGQIQRSFTNDEIFEITFLTHYCNAYKAGYSKEEAEKMAIARIVDRLNIVGNPRQDPLFSPETYKMAADVILFDLCP